MIQEFDRGYHATFSRLSRIFRSRGLASEDAEDLAQEAVLRTLNHLDRHGRRPGDLTPLMNTIAKNLVIERFRTGGRELPFVPDDRLVAPLGDPADDITRLERRERVDAAIELLPARQRVAVRMWLEGAGPAEIANELGLKRNAADALLHRARRFLASKLEDVRDSAWGGVLLTRLRGMVRRTTEWLAPIDVAMFAPAIAAGLVIALSSPAAVRHDHERVPPVPPKTTDIIQFDDNTQRIAEGATNRITALKGGDRSSSRDRWNPVVVTIGEPRVTASTPPIRRANGERLPIWVSIYEDESDTPGLTTPLMDAAHVVLDPLCERSPELCGGE